MCYCTKSANRFQGMCRQLEDSQSQIAHIGLQVSIAVAPRSTFAANHRRIMGLAVRFVAARIVPQLLEGERWG